ncbi:TPA: helix-turn-helix domain-containing protein [Klebsiella aerogenes]|nr:helix-turn-helix domain-containing protein [Salmonella enterica subsp. enterica serovar Saintpaul str. CFSAN004154]
MSQNPDKNKSFSFKNNGSFNQFGLKSVIQDISPKFLRPGEKYILMQASEHATASDQLCIFKSLKTIAEDCGVSKDTVRRCLTRCVEMGILTKEFVIDKETGKQKPCLYTYTKRFVWIAKAFRRVADTLKSRRQKDFKEALSRFNTALQRMVFLAKVRFSLLKEKLFAKGYPPKFALKQGLQNATQGDSKIEPNKVIPDQVNKSSAGAIEKIDAVKKSKNGMVRSLQDIQEKFAAFALLNHQKKQKNNQNDKLEQNKARDRRKDPAQPPQPKTSFQHTRYREADRQAEDNWNERQRISREMTPEKKAQNLAKIRALLNSALAQKA